MGLSYKRYFDTTNKDEELGSVVIRREDEGSVPTGLLRCCSEGFQGTRAQHHKETLKIYFQRAGNVPFKEINKINQILSILTLKVK